MDDAYAALTGHGNRHPVLCHGIHTGTHQRYIQLNLFCQHRTDIDIIRNNFRVGRYKKNVIKSNAFTDDFSHLDISSRFSRISKICCLKDTSFYCVPDYQTSILMSIQIPSQAFFSILNPVGTAGP